MKKKFYSFCHLSGTLRIDDVLMFLITLRYIITCSSSVAGNECADKNFEQKKGEHLKNFKRYANNTLRLLVANR